MKLNKENVMKVTDNFIPKEWGSEIKGFDKKPGI